ncbi:hypothetical protein BY458DRAFT_505595 [Sporodiniella umbellata]|nr:hypothetical protein BY458DRAFT_505595 [Sporodiniella umbellata]
MEEIDYYGLLEIEITASSKEIQRAYRKKSLKVHPDKNPSPDAAALFHTLSLAYEALMDDKKRSEYDQKHRARQERLKKKNEMDVKRRKAQDDLERRENEAKRAKMNQNQAKAEHEAQLARMRKEGAERRQEYWNTENKTTEEAPPSEHDCALKFKWKRKKYDFSDQDIAAILEPLAKVDIVALSEKKKGSAVVLFETVLDAYGIIMRRDVHPALCQFESIDWAKKSPPALVEKMHREEELKKQAKAAFYNVHDRPTSVSGQPLFATHANTSFFKPSPIPRANVSWC